MYRYGVLCLAFVMKEYFISGLINPTGLDWPIWYNMQRTKNFSDKMAVVTVRDPFQNEVDVSPPSHANNISRTRSTYSNRHVCEFSEMDLNSLAS